MSPKSKARLKERVERLNTVLWPQSWSVEARLVLTGAVLGTLCSATAFLLLIILVAVT
jgi:hypothetical protein